MAGEVGLDDGYQRARISDVEGKIKQARSFLADVSRREVEHLEQNEFSAFKQAFRKLSQEVKRIAGMIEAMKPSFL